MAFGLGKKRKPSYHLNDTGKNLELSTPYGPIWIEGDYAPDGVYGYRMEIPLSEIRPEEPEEAPKAKVAEEPVAPKETPKETTREVAYYWPPMMEKGAKMPGDEEEEAPPKKAEPVVEKPTYDNSDYRIALANKAFNQMEYHRALELVESVLEKHPNNVRAWIMKGSLMHVLGQKDLSRTAWEKAQTLDPNNAEIKSILEKYTK